MTQALKDQLELTIDKFTFRFPKGLFYSDAGVWVSRENDLARMGLSDFAQQRNGDIAFVSLMPAGTIVDVNDEVAGIETVKVNVSIPSPLKGTVEEVNTALLDTPEWINQEPYTKGWLVVLRLREPVAGLDRLMDAAAYLELSRRQAEEEARR